MKKNKKIYLIMLAMVLCLGLMACSKEESVASEVEPTETGIKTSMEEVENIAGKVEEASIGGESTVEDAEDAALYIPEGIDVESTLPGEEWVASFVGKVNEPVVVIYNDDTGRKEVVQAGSEVIVNPDEDIIAIYWNEISMGCTTHAISTDGIIKSDYYEIEIMDSKKMREIPERPVKVTVMGGEEDWTIEFTILVQ